MNIRNEKFLTERKNSIQNSPHLTKEKMPNINRVRGGRKAQQIGQMFEDVFLLKARSQGIAIDRFPPGCKTVGRMIIRVKTPYDFILSFKGGFSLLDTKCHDNDHLIASRIEDHQLASLLMHEKQGVKAGYLIFFRKTNEIRFLSASSLDLIKRGLKDVPSVLLGTITDFDLRLLFEKEIT